MTLGARQKRSRSVSVAVVGLGYWGPNLVRNLYELPDVEVAAVCDVRADALEHIRRRYPAIYRTPAYEELLASDAVDAVLLATPVSSHYELALAALRAGKHVFVEKPLASSFDEARELCACAADSGLVLMPGHTFLYSPPVLKIKQLIDVGTLGQIYFISSSRVNLGLHQPDVSVVWDLGPHDFSILRFWLGESPTQISTLARSCVLPGVPDVAFMNLEFPSGTVAHVELSWLSPSKLRRTAIVGSEKMVVYDDTSNESVRIFDSGATLPDPETFGEYRMSYRTGDIVSPRIDAAEPLSLQLAEFAAAIRGGVKIRSTPELGLEVVRMIEAAHRSLAGGGVPTPLEELAPAAVEAAVAEEESEEVFFGPYRSRDTNGHGPSRNEDGSDSVGTLVLGGGPAGLTAAYVLGLRNARGAVLEADGTVGGIAKTVEFNGYRFDLGGHRFFTKLKPIERLWEQMLGDELLVRPRLSRIFYDGKFLQYPLTSRDVVARLGLVESTLCALSYLWAVCKPSRPAESFEDWVTKRFGKRLYDAFFASYTEKVWGIPGTEIRSQWAAQRIRNFSFWRAMLSVLGLSRTQVTTLIEEFRYPRLGPGQMWEHLQGRVEGLGIPVFLNHRAVQIRHAAGRVESVVVRSNGDEFELPVDSVLSSIPLSELVLGLDPPPPAEVVEAARSLRYRDFCLVALISEEEEPFPDTWIYLHDPETRAGRVQNYGAWSSAMVQPGTTCLGVEYFCFAGDEIWEMSDDEAVRLATSELARIGLIDPERVVDGLKVRVPKAYPMYDMQYTAALDVIRPYLAEFANLQTFGRNGLHRYNNQDHSMWTAVLATLNHLDGTDYDVWAVNTDAEYLEEGEIVDSLLASDLGVFEAGPTVPVATMPRASSMRASARADGRGTGSRTPEGRGAGR